MVKHLKNILVVDDEKVFAETVSRHLRMVGHTVHTAYSGAEGKALLEKEMTEEDKSRMDIVITDINMPQLNGLEFIQWIHAELPRISIIAVTGFSALTTISSMLREKTDRLVMKPLTPSQMLELIDSLQVQDDSSEK